MSEDSQINVEQAKQALERSFQSRRTQCASEIQEVLKKHGCKLEAIAIIRNAAVQTSIEIALIE